MRLLLLLVCVMCCAAAAPDQRPHYPPNIHEMVKAHLAAGRRSRTPKGHSWGPWTGWSECSSSCGGGVRSQTRQCLSGPLKQPSAGRRRSKQGCLGLYRRYHVCNTQHSCPVGDLRDAQCSSFDSRPFGGRLFRWTPFLDAPEQCQLNCRADGHRFYATLNQTVVDGTACWPPQRQAAAAGRLAAEQWVCVSGECKHVGCDGVVGSERRWDACGECGGRNTSCRIASGLFSNHAGLVVGALSTITTLPRGACNISAVQVAPTASRFVLRRTATGQPLSFEVAAFQHQPAEAAKGESLTARGPLPEAIDLAVLYGGGLLGVRYQFGLPTTDVVQQDEAAPAGGQRPRRRSKKFAWQMVAASECSKSCGGGLQAAKSVCVREGGVQVPEKRCGHVERPTVRNMRCNARPCPAEWEYGPWGPCSATCGHGTQARAVACRQHISASMTNMKVNDAACLGQRGARTQPCNLGLCEGPRPSDALFSGENETPLPSSGGGGHGGHHHQAHHGRWLTTSWSEGCACGTGLQTRRVACSAASCEAPNRPADSRPCARACREAQWFSGPWSQCSTRCGPGRQSRSVLCVRGRNGVEEEQCAGHERPAADRPCEERPCGGQWFSSEWGACEEDCGPQSREVRCLDEAAKPDQDCAADERPAARRPCSSCSSKSAVEANVVGVDLPRAQLLARTDHEVENCRDVMRDCGLVLRARLCANRFYRSRCCVTCSRASP